MPMNGFLASLAFTTVLGVSVAFGQPKLPVSTSQEFPILMRQNIVAGKTPVGTKVEATLTLATLIGGKVVPEGATFSGVVVESAGKSATGPSRLSVLIDSVRWKKGSEPVKAYLTAWYYPAQLSNENGYDFSQPGGRAGTYDPTLPPYPRRSPDKLPEPPTPTSSNAEHRVAIKNVDSVRNNDAGIVLTSTHSNIKFDKSTTYVLATGDLTNPPSPNPDSNGKSR